MMRPGFALGTAALLSTITGCGDPLLTTPDDPAPRVFPGSVFWQPIPADAAVDPGSAGYISDLLAHSQSGGRIDIDLTSYNVPVYLTNGATPLVSVQVAGPSMQVPLPSGAAPASGSDADLVSLDVSAGRSYELWQARQSGAAWSASAAATFTTSGDGVNPPGQGIRATNLSLLLGLITYDEIQGGEAIQHALAWTFDFPSSQYYSPPATGSDGNKSGGRSTSIPAGARLQLDPSLDLSTLGLTPVGLRLAQALQRYGMFCVDSGGNSSVVAEVAYAGRSWDGLLGYDALHAIPIDRLRVLALPAKIPIP